METLVGAEYHRYAGQGTSDKSSDPGEFIRIVQRGPTTYIRQGVRGTPGNLDIHRHTSTESARAIAAAAIAERTVDRELTERCFLTMVVPDLSLDPEEQFLSEWRSATFARHPSEPALPPPRYALVTGALAERTRDTAAATVLATIEDGPHAADPGADLVVGLVPRVPIIHPNTQARQPNRGSYDSIGRHLNVHTIDAPSRACVHGYPSCAPCTQRMVDLVLFLCRGCQVRTMGLDRRNHIVATAARLVRSHAAPASV